MALRRLKLVRGRGGADDGFSQPASEFSHASKRSCVKDEDEEAVEVAVETKTPLEVGVSGDVFTPVSAGFSDRPAHSVHPSAFQRASCVSLEGIPPLNRTDKPPVTPEPSTQIHKQSPLSRNFTTPVAPVPTRSRTPTSLSYWGVPLSVCGRYAAMGIRELYPWQVDCLGQVNAVCA
jgi:hypothetical protein